VVIWFH